MGNPNECTECFRLEATCTVFLVGPEMRKVPAKDSAAILQNEVWHQTENAGKHNQYLCVIHSMLARISKWWKFTPTAFHKIYII